MTVSAPVVLRVNGEQVLVQGRRQCLVRSKSSPKLWHSVEINDRNESECSCTGWTVRKTCRHARAIREWMLGRAQVTLVEAEDG